jgi:hypothetical protein
MTKLLEQAIKELRNLPEKEQDAAADARSLTLQGTSGSTDCAPTRLPKCIASAARYATAPHASQPMPMCQH